MPLRQQILGSQETFADLAWAAESRFRDGETLLVEGRFTGAVYLIGLASEMWLKLAAFRLGGAGPGTRVAGLWGPIRAWMAARVPALHPESYHSLRFWAEYVIRRRAESGRALPAPLAGALRHHAVGRLFQDWKIDMRYRQVVLSERQAWRVYNDARWIREARDALWR